MWVIGLIMLSVGIVLGMSIFFAINRARSKKNSIGTLRIDNSDPDDGPYLFLELKTPVDKVKKMSRVSMNVEVSNYLSQK